MPPDQAAANRTEPRYLRLWRASSELDGCADDLQESAAIANAKFNPATLKPKHGVSSEVPSLDAPPPAGAQSSQPIGGASMSPEAIRDIVSGGWPGSTVESITPLGEGKSFNNKIYFLKIRHSEGASGLGVQDAVLKVNGTLYDSDKVQNEVALPAVA